MKEVYGGNVEECAYNLLQSKIKGESAFLKFNGHVLYSDNVDILDDVYKECIRNDKR